MVTRHALGSVGVDDNKPALIKVTDTPYYLVLESDRQYVVQHTGLQINGTTVNTAAVMLSTLASVEPAAEEAIGRLTLVSGHQVFIGPGVKYLAFDALTTDVGINILPDVRLGLSW